MDQEKLNLVGTSRAVDAPNALWLFFNRSPTDVELRSVHDRLAAPSEPAQPGAPPPSSALLDEFLAAAERDGVTHLRVSAAPARQAQAVETCPTCGLAGHAIADERDAYSRAMPEWKALAESLMAMIGRISDALGFSEGDQARATGDEEILDRIAELVAPASGDESALSDEQIDAICAPGRAQRWKGDGRQYDRDTVRLALAGLHAPADLKPWRDAVDVLMHRPELADRARIEALLDTPLQQGADARHMLRPSVAECIAQLDRWAGQLEAAIDREAQDKLGQHANDEPAAAARDPMEQFP